MKAILLMMTWIGAGVCAHAGESQELIGKWQAVGYIYQDTFIQPPDPQLTLIFEFFEDGTNRLFWQMKNETSFCERKGEWKVVKGILHETIVWVNPNNGMGCSGDPDMEIGRENQAPFWRQDTQLFVEIPLGDETLVYVWELRTEKGVTYE